MNIVRRSKSPQLPIDDPRQVDEPVGQIVRDDRGAAGDLGQHGAVDRQRAERDDDRRNLGVGDEQSVDQPEHRADRDGQQDRHDRRAGPVAT